MPTQSIHIEPGFGEGVWHSNILHKLLKNYDFSRADSAGTSDIFITHSAGCFFLPPRLPEQTVIVIGPPYWPGKYLWLSFLQKICRDFNESRKKGRLPFFFHKTTWNIAYIIRDIPKAIRIHFSARQHDFYTAFHSEQFILIRNSKNSFCTPHIVELLKGKGSFKFYELPGEHEDVWLEPEAHAALIHQVLAGKS